MLDIAAAIQRAMSDEFKVYLGQMEIAHADGKIAVRMKEILKQVNLQGICQKHFYDLK